MSRIVRFHIEARKVQAGKGLHHFCPVSHEEYHCDVLGCRVPYVAPKELQHSQWAINSADSWDWEAQPNGWGSPPEPAPAGSLYGYAKTAQEV